MQENTRIQTLKQRKCLNSILAQVIINLILLYEVRVCITKAQFRCQIADALSSSTVAEKTVSQ